MTIAFVLWLVASPVVAWLASRFIRAGMVDAQSKPDAMRNYIAQEK